MGVEGMRKILFVLLIISLQVGCIGRSNKEPEVITIRVLSFGFEETRVNNLIDAASKINEEFKDEGINKIVEVKVEKYTGQLWDDYDEIFKERYENEGLDIFIIGHEDIGWLASDGYIVPLDKLTGKDTFKDVYSTLWQSVEWQGNKWGILQDFEVQLILANKEKLLELGWDEEAIAELPNQVKKGQFTLDDMTEIAEEAVKKGIVTNGILHRPVNGQAFYMMAKNFGAFYYDEDNGEVTISQSGLLSSLQYYYDIAREKEVLPTDNTLKNWEQINEIVIQGDVLFYYGATYTMYDLVTESGADLNKILDDYEPMLIPAAKDSGKPITISHPLVYTVTSISENKEIAYKLLEYGSNPEAQAIHAVETYHLPVTKSARDSEKFKENQFLNDLMYTLDYTSFLPNDDEFNIIYQAYFDAIQDVELGLKEPEEAALQFQKSIKKQFENKCYIKE